MYDSRRLQTLVLSFVLMMLGSALAKGGPTCSDSPIIDVEVHGHHIVADYVMGTGHPNVDWPPSGLVGEATRGEGAAVPGGPGPAFHFVNEVAPGASFCNPKAKSPGFHQD